MASGRLIVPISEPILLASGEPDSGATMLINISGGPVAAASVFADPGLTIGIANPLTSNSAGRFYEQATVWWLDSSQAYDVTVTLTDGSELTFDQLYTLGAQTNITGFAPLNSPALTGTPTAPTPALNDSSGKLATTQYVQSQGYAPSASPALTGVPTAPTAVAGTDTTQIATTDFVNKALGVTLPTGTTSGYALIGGLYLQWTGFSLGAAGGASQAVTWPIKFPTNIVGLPWVAVTNAALGMIGVTAATSTGATVEKSSTDTSARTGTVWAFGY